MTSGERFWARVDQHGPTPIARPDLGPCWVWVSTRRPDGYVQATIDGNTRFVHRYAYEQLVGPIPEGLTIDHLCRVRHCVNPEHLEPVTQRENILRGEGPSALNAVKTHCVNGHEFTPENTYRRPSGDRTCRACQLETVKRYQKRRAQVAA